MLIPMIIFAVLGFIPSSGLRIALIVVYAAAAAWSMAFVVVNGIKLTKSAKAKVSE